MTRDTDINRWSAIVGPCYTKASFARALGWTEVEVVEAATSRTVLELLTDDGVVLYPDFQIWKGRPVAGLGDVLSVLCTGTRSPWTWAQWLNTQADDESGATVSSAIEQLRAGKSGEVLRDARHAAWSWSS